MNKIKIVIIGGGFGGVYTARNLLRTLTSDQADITLITATNYFLFTPLLHEVATGGLTPDSITESIREIFRGTRVNVIENTAREIDSKNRVVKTNTENISYDFLVISNGSEVNYFNTQGAQENCFTLKNLSDAIKIRNNILETCEKAVQTKNKELLVSSVIGAGPTGVEFAIEILEYMQHTICTYYKDSGFTKDDIKVFLITTTSDVISNFPQKMRDVAMIELIKKGIIVLTNKIVSKVEPQLLTFKDGQTLQSNTLVWTAGVSPSSSKIKGVFDGEFPAVSASTNMRIETNEYLQTTKNPEIFALGDASGTHPMLAQVAVQQAKIVAYNISSLINKTEPTPFIFKQKGLLLSIGQWYAVGNFGNEKFSITLKGRLMWWIWRTVYLFNFLSWRKRFEIASEWTTNLFCSRDITYLK